MDPALAELGMDLERHVTSLAEAGADAVQELSTIGPYRELRPRTPGLGVTHNFAVSLRLSPVKAPVGNSLVHSICPRDVSVVVLCQPPGSFLEAKAGYGFPLHVVDLHDTEPVARGNRTIISDLYWSAERQHVVFAARQFSAPCLDVFLDVGFDADPSHYRGQRRRLSFRRVER